MTDEKKKEAQGLRLDLIERLVRVEDDEPPSCGRDNAITTVARHEDDEAPAGERPRPPASRAAD